MSLRESPQFGMDTRLQILIVHNTYQQRGGEDLVVEDEVRLLRKHGHVVEIYGRNNYEIASLPRLLLAGQTLWSNRTVSELARVIAIRKPDIIHVHNTFPLISPSLYWAADRANIPLVQTLHNFRLVCVQAMLLRDDNPCEDCVGHLPWRGVVRRCYRGSIVQSGLLAGMLTFHRAIGTWKNRISRYIALNDFSREKFIEGGLPADRITVKPNFVDLPPPTNKAVRIGALFVGRLSPEKGIATLAEAAKLVPEVRIRVIGTGTEDRKLRGIRNVEVIGFEDAEGVRAAMSSAACLVMPSICYENFPRSLVEAFACGLPVIGSRLGAMVALIEEGETGLLFEPGSADDLAAKLAWAQAHPQRLSRMGRAARSEYERKYTPDINYKQLWRIYDEAIKTSSQANI